MMRNDFVRRSDVMDSMVKEYNRRYSLGERNGLHLAWIEKAVNDVPSAQPYTDEEIQKMQDIEQEMLEKAYECGREDAKPERKRGRWNPDPINGVKPYGYICNLCGAWQPVERNYCPNCGADMRETWEVKK